MNRNTLKARLGQPGLVCATGIFDGISARIADAMDERVWDFYRRNA